MFQFELRKFLKRNVFKDEEQRSGSMVSLSWTHRAESGPGLLEIHRGLSIFSLEWSHHVNCEQDRVTLITDGPHVQTFRNKRVSFMFGFKKNLK